MKHETKHRMPFYIATHPFDGFESLKYRNLGSLGVSLWIFLAFALLDVFRRQFMGKQLQMVDPNDINLPMAIFSAFLIVFCWTLSNWCFCVLIEGKATLKKIWIISVYSLLPYTAAEYLNILLGLVLTQEENVFRTIITVIGVLWTFVLIVSAFMNFHEFEFSKAILAIVLTFIGMIIIAILVFLVYSLFQQLFSNIMVLVNEIVFRIKLAG